VARIGGGEELQQFRFDRSCLDLLADLAIHARELRIREKPAVRGVSYRLGPKRMDKLTA